jgi:hypothetical protein
MHKAERGEKRTGKEGLRKGSGEQNDAERRRLKPPGVAMSMEKID